MGATRVARRPGVQVAWEQERDRDRRPGDDVEAAAPPQHREDRDGEQDPDRDEREQPDLRLGGVRRLLEVEDDLPVAEAMVLEPAFSAGLAASSGIVGVGPP